MAEGGLRLEAMVTTDWLRRVHLVLSSHASMFLLEPGPRPEITITGERRWTRLIAELAVDMLVLDVGSGLEVV